MERSVKGSRWAASLVLIALTSEVMAAPSTPGPTTSASTAEQRKAAAAKFKEGETAFNAGDYLRAGAVFEEAYHIAPHPAVLWNAARAWQRGGDERRAAGLYARYLRDAAPDAPDRKTATSSLVQLSAKLGRFEIQAPGSDEVRVDGDVVEGAIAFVYPGSHSLRATYGNKTVERSLSVDAGATINVSLSAPSEAAPPTPVTTASTSPAGAPPLADRRAPPTVASHSGWSPAVIVVGGIATLAAGGVTVWSGLDTNRARSEFDRDPSEENLTDGRAKQTRTNVLIGVTAGLAVLTAATAIFLVDWGGKKPAEVGVGPGFLTLRGSF